MKFTDSVRSRACVGMVLLFLVALPAFSVAQPTPPRTFVQIVQMKAANSSCKLSAACTCSIADENVASRLLAEYGSIFAAAETVKLPNKCIFENESHVSEFQRGAPSKIEVINGVAIELQEPAMTALLAAQQQAANIGVSITPLDGTIAAKRSYLETILIWNSRFLKALDHWIRLGKISVEEANAARNDTVLNQIRKVIAWESAGLNFGTGVKRSIFSSTAPPGTSQHLSMLAFDVVQYSNRDVREIMNSHGWFQTIVNDPPHFTYLGLPEIELPSRGLKVRYAGGQKYWVPDMLLPPPVETRPIAPSPTPVR